jgi:hypothetical protein
MRSLLIGLGISLLLFWIIPATVAAIWEVAYVNPFTSAF